MNLLFCVAFAAFVLYASVGSASARSGSACCCRSGRSAGWSAPWRPRLLERFGPGLLLRAGLVIETATQATSPRPVPRGSPPRSSSSSACTRGVGRRSSSSLRQRLVPDRLRGRVGSVFALLELGGAAVGTLPGGLLAGATSLTTPYWVAAAGMVALTVAVWPRFTDAVLSPPQPAPTP